METGTWTEGRHSGETDFLAGDTFIEDVDTVHWFFNRGEQPATVIVCEIKADVQHMDEPGAKDAFAPNDVTRSPAGPRRG